MKIENDLYDINKKLIIEAGQVINRSVLEKIASLTDRIRYLQIKESPLMKDILESLDDERYSHILYPPETNQKIIHYIGRIKMPENILRELERMKKVMNYTYHHLLIISIVATKISLTSSSHKYVPEMAASLCLFHDLGKSRLPLHILNKRTALTTEERHILRMHPLLGYVLLHYYFGRDHKKYDFSAFQHHERIDGSGYPLGIKRLNKYSHLIGVVDTLDALISERPYRKKPYTLRAAIDFLLSESEKGRFHKGLVHTLIRYARKADPYKKIIVGVRGRDKEPAVNYYGKTEIS